MESQFLELIKTSIGSAGCLSKTPTPQEWNELYELAKKHSLVGVCFSGVQKLQTQNQIPPEMLYLTWMGMAAKIQQRNEVLNCQCVELQARLSTDGFKSCILKGQGVAQSYSENLRGLRQSGDIDIWVDASLDAQLEYANSIVPTHDFNKKDIHFRFFEDTEVELHVTPAFLRYPPSDKVLQRWFNDVKNQEMNHKVQIAGGRHITASSPEFNLLFLLIHKYRHLTEEGIGLRHLVDYYYVLKGCDSVDKSRVNTILHDLQMVKFAGAVMWIMHNVLGLQDSWLLCKPNEKEGLFLLNEIIEGGNFGRFDTRYERYKRIGGRKGMLLYTMRHGLNLAKHYPKEVLFEPIWLIKHYVWKRTVMRKWL